MKFVDIAGTIEPGIIAHMKAISDPSIGGANPFADFASLEDDEATVNRDPEVGPIRSYPLFESVLVSLVMQQSNLIGAATQQTGTVAWNAIITCAGMDDRVGGRRGAYGGLHCSGLVADKLNEAGWAIVPNQKVTVDSISLFQGPDNNENPLVKYVVAFHHSVIISNQ